MAIPRDLELRIHGHLEEIRDVNDEVLESRQGFPSSKKGYERTLKSVAKCATIEEVDQVAENVKGHIREENERPSNRMLRREARSIVSRSGYPANSFLNAA